MKQVSSSRRSVVAQTVAMAAAGAVCNPGAAAAAAADTSSPSSGYRVVFQVSDADPSKWNLTLNNVRNALLELGAEHTKVEVIAFGPGIGMLMATAEPAGRVAEAIKAGVSVYACENTMRGQKLSPNQMNSLIGYVPSGVAHLIRRQTEGYAYIRS
jgi:uncharacterized protein